MGAPVDPSMMMLDPAFRRDPHPALRALRDAGPVQQSRSTGIYFVLGHPEGVFVQRSSKLGRDLRRWKSPFNWSSAERRERDPIGFRMFSEIQPQMFNSDPPDHRRMRSVFQHAFTPPKVAQMRQVVEREAERLIGALPVTGTLDLMQCLAGPLPVRVIGGLFGVPEADAERLVHWSAAQVHTLEPTISRLQQEAALQAVIEFKAYLQQLVDERRARPGDGLIDHVIAAEAVEGGLSPDELLTNLQSMLVAGHETTTSLIGNGTLTLLRHPSEFARLRTDPGLFPTAIEELLRFEPPGNINARVAIEDVEVGAALIPEGSMVIVLLAAVNRDASVFVEPDRLDVARDPNPHQTFGGGMHHCIGAPLARLEAEVAFRQLFSRYRHIELAGEAVWHDRINLRGLTMLPLRVEA